MEGKGRQMHTLVNLTVILRGCGENRTTKMLTPTVGVGTVDSRTVIGIMGLPVPRGPKVTLKQALWATFELGCVGSLLISLLFYV